MDRKSHDGWAALLAIQDPPADTTPLGVRTFMGVARAPLEFVLSTDDFTPEQRRAWVEHLLGSETELDPAHCYPAACAAGERGHKRLLELIAEAGVSFHRFTVMKRTPLHGAAAKATRSVVQFILDQGVDVNAQDDSGQTALHWAVRAENKPVYKTLYAAGANWKIQDVKDESPLSELRTRHPHQANWWALRPTRDALVQGLAAVQPAVTKAPRSRL